MKHCSAEDLVSFGVRFLTSKGADAGDARVVADTVVQTQAMGIHTHGLALFPYFHQNIPERVDARAQPRLVRESGVGAVIEGDFGFAQLAMRLAKEVAASKAAKLGAALVTVSRCSWLGALGPYLHSLAQQGFLAQLWAQTTNCKDAAPHGGIDATFSTNPMALAIPTRGDPILSDFSTTTISMGKLKRMAHKGEQAPEPIFLDAKGSLSRDPRVALAGGSVLLVGGPHYGYKGYALSLWAEAIAALAGGECNNPDTRISQSVGLLVIDPRAFGGQEHFYGEIEGLKEHVRASRPRPGFAAVRLPGERLGHSLRESADSGIPVEETLLETLNALAAEHGLPPIPAR